MAPLSSSYTPRLILHGGAGLLATLPPSEQKAYKHSLSQILAHGLSLLHSGTSALDTATSCVQLFESDPLFNCGHGAVFTRAGTIELEASVMVSSGLKKRGAAVSGIKHVKHPVVLVREMLARGEGDLEGRLGGIDGASDVNGNGGVDDPFGGLGGAQGHVHVHGKGAERLARGYGLEMVENSFFFTRKRWEEHRRSLEEEKRKRKDAGVSSLANEESLSWKGFCAQNNVQLHPGTGAEGLPWDGLAALPQGTVGCVAMDSNGVICTATSTGGLTNKLPGRIGDTPTFGAGFWAEEGELLPAARIPAPTPMRRPYEWTLPVSLADWLPPAIAECLPSLQTYTSLRTSPSPYQSPLEKTTLAPQTHALGLSGTGNGDSFLRTAACHTASTLALPAQIPAHLLPRLSPLQQQQCSSGVPLSIAVSAVAGPGGLLQSSAGDRWGRTGEGQGGMIGIERRGGDSKVVFAMNCPGMFRAYVDDEGKAWVGIYRGDDEEIELEY